MTPPIDIIKLYRDQEAYLKFLQSVFNNPRKEKVSDWKTKLKR